MVRSESIADRNDVLARWLLAHDGTLTADEAAAFEAWLAVSPENAAAWKKARALWSEFDEAPDALLESWRRKALTSRPNTWTRLPNQAAAAAVIGIVAIGALSWRSWSDRNQGVGTKIAEAAAVGYSTGRSRTEFSLPDGTRMLLDASSSVSVREGQTHRDVTVVRGRAFFTVAHDISRPFVVAAGDRTVTATGTAFEVWLRPTAVAVVLTRGHVSISDPSGRTADIRLNPGESFEALTGQSGTVRPADVNAALAWRSGFLEFNRTPINDAVAEMNSYAQAPMVVDDPTAGNQRITGRYRTDDPEGFAGAITAIFPIRIEHGSDGRVHIRSR